MRISDNSRTVCCNFRIVAVICKNDVSINPLTGGYWTNVVANNVYWRLYWQL